MSFTRTPPVSLLLAVLTLICTVATAEDAQEQPPGNTQIPLWIFDAQVRAAAPGIETIITLTDEQKAKLQVIYDQVFSAPTLQSTQKVLLDQKATPEERQEASSVIQTARNWFAKRCNAEVFTPEQLELIRKVYAAYAQVQAEVRREVAAMITRGLAGRLDDILSPEQKAAMAKARADLKAAVKAAAKAQEQSAQQQPDETPQ